jgi:hypothetical protein
MSITSKVRQSVVLTADGQVQALVAGSAANITEIKIYNEIGAGATASALIYHGKFGTNSQ